MKDSRQLIIEKLEMINLEVGQKRLESSRLLLEASSYSYYLGSLDSSIGERIAATGEAIAIQVKRTECVVKADLIRESFNQYIQDHISFPHDAKELLHSYGVMPSRYITPIMITTIDLDNRATNEDWFVQLSDEISIIDNHLEEFSQYCRTLIKQLREVKCT